MNWRGRPLVSHEVIVETISAVTTRTGLKVTAVLDTGLYPKGIRIPDKDMKAFEARHLQRHEFHGNWNYTLPAIPPGDTTPESWEIVIARTLTLVITRQPRSAPPPGDPGGGSGIIAALSMAIRSAGAHSRCRWYRVLAAATHAAGTELGLPAAWSAGRALRDPAPPRLHCARRRRYVGGVRVLLPRTPAVAGTIGLVVS